LPKPINLIQHVNQQLADHTYSETNAISFS